MTDTGTTRRDYLKALGAGAAAIGLAGCNEDDGPLDPCARYEQDVADLLDAVHPDHVERHYQDEEVRAWRHLKAHQEHLHSVYEQAKTNAEADCEARPEGDLLVGEQHGMGDGIKTMATHMEKGDYDVLALEFFAQDDPVVEAFNNEAVYEGVYDRFDGKVIGPSEMAEHYLHPLLERRDGSETPIRWNREHEQLERMFRAVKDSDAELVGIEPDMYHPLYPDQYWGDETGSIEDSVQFTRDRFETMADNVQTAVEGEGTTLGLSGYAHVQNEMHAPMSLLIGSLPGFRDTFATEDSIEHPWSYQALIGSIDLPFYAMDEETFTYRGRMPDVNTMLSTSPAEQFGQYNGVFGSMDRDTAFTDLIADLDVETRDLLSQDLRGVTPATTDTYFDFHLDLQSSADFDDAESEFVDADTATEMAEAAAQISLLEQALMDDELELA